MNQLAPIRVLHTIRVPQVRRSTIAPTMGLLLNALLFVTPQRSGQICFYPRRSGSTYCNC